MNEIIRLRKKRIKRAIKYIIRKYGTSTKVKITTSYHADRTYTIVAREAQNFDQEQEQGFLMDQRIEKAELIDTISGNHIVKLYLFLNMKEFSAKMKEVK